MSTGSLLSYYYLVGASDFERIIKEWEVKDIIEMLIDSVKYTTREEHTEMMKKILLILI
jgi:hypothetical protein